MNLKLKLAVTLITTIFLSSAAYAQFLPNLEEVNLPEKGIEVESDFEVSLVLNIQNGLKLNREAPSKIKFMWLDKTGRLLEGAESKQVAVESTDLRQSLRAPSGHDNLILKADSTLYYCDVAGKSVCYIKSYRFIQPIKILHEEVKENFVKFEADLSAP